ncbi:MAG TPA: DUF4350 domain-containing protein [Solirubrobacteraceae bacterium]|nr:DUF4350 domain-containing protein [Solirubrobacteraceae bacterium]
MSATVVTPRRLLLPAALLFFAVIAVAIIGAPESAGPMLDPRSTDPAGGKALVDVLTELDVEVDAITGAPPAAATTALIYDDRYPDDVRDDIRAWVEAGGRLVVADPASPLLPGEVLGNVGASGFDGLDIAPGCDAEGLAGVRSVAASTWAAIDVPEGATGCFALASSGDEPDGYGLVIAAAGEGEVIGLGGAWALTNGELGDADNGVLGVALLAPGEGGSVAIITSPPLDAAERSLPQLVPSRVRFLGLQLLVGFVVLVWWRGRRHGAVVQEPQTTPIPGSELVQAVGALLQRSGSRDEAAQLLRESLRQDLVGALGVPTATPWERLAEIAAARSGVAVEQVRTALAPRELRNDAELVALARAVRAVRRGVAVGAGTGR